MKKLLPRLRCALLTTTLLTSASATACRPSSTILIPPGMPVQLAEAVRARVIVRVEGKWVVVGPVDIPAGWWCLPDEEAPAPSAPNLGKETSNETVAR